MENALFYTFSTIAQTLAAAIALLGAFALYRLQTIATDLEGTGITLLQAYLPNDDARVLLAEGKHSELLEQLARIPPRNATMAATVHFIGTKKGAAALIDAQRDLRRILNVALALSVVVITGAVVVLAVTPAIAACVGAPQWTFIIGIGSLSASPCMPLWSARRSVRRYR